MIRMEYKGQTGNQLFQYAFARLTLEGAEMELPAVSGFQELPTHFEGESYFERASRLIDRREEICSWFELDEDQILGLGIHIRGGDAAKEGFRCPPFSYYDTAIRSKTPYGTIFTDDPENPVVIQVREKYDFPVVHHRDPICDFHLLRRHAYLIIGNSTFAWWAAFLSGHNDVIQPEPTSGWRSRLDPKSCLLVPQWTQIRYAP